MTPTQVCIHLQQRRQFVTHSGDAVYPGSFSEHAMAGSSNEHAPIFLHLRQPLGCNRTQRIHANLISQSSSVAIASARRFAAARNVSRVARRRHCQGAHSCQVTHPHSVIPCCPICSCISILVTRGTEAMCLSHRSPSCHDSYRNAITSISARNASSESKARLARALRGLRRPFHRRPHPHEPCTAKRVCIR